jgi:hypothetical protein
MPENPEVGWPKSAGHVRAYESLLGHLRGERFALLELGVDKGDSLAMWRDGFPEATIVGVDIEIPDLGLGPRVHLVNGDQRDGELLAEIRRSFAPEGFEVIIDDASHQGAHSARSLQALFVEHLRPGGLYVVEDWRMGYYVPYEGALTTSRLDETVPDGRSEDRMPSHDYGLVGLVKRLIDHLGAETIQATATEQEHSPLPVASLTINKKMAVLRRAS